MIWEHWINSSLAVCDDKRRLISGIECSDETVKSLIISLQPQLDEFELRATAYDDRLGFVLRNTFLVTTIWAIPIYTELQRAKYDNHLSILVRTPDNLHNNVVETRPVVRDWALEHQPQITLAEFLYNRENWLNKRYSEWCLNRQAEMTNFDQSKIGRSKEDQELDKLYEDSFAYKIDEIKSELSKLESVFSIALDSYKKSGVSADYVRRAIRSMAESVDDSILAQSLDYLVLFNEEAQKACEEQGIFKQPKHWSTVKISIAHSEHGRKMDVDKVIKRFIRDTFQPVAFTVKLTEE